MKEVEVKFIASDGAIPPVYKTKGAAGADVCALLDKDLVLRQGERAAVPTGLFVEVPEGYEIQVRPRSGLAFKNGVTVLNTPGTIDSDYRGELMVILANFVKPLSQAAQRQRVDALPATIRQPFRLALQRT